MRSRFLLVCSLLLLVSSARADTLFSVSGTFADGSLLSGTFTLNTATGNYTGANVSIVTGGTNYTFITPTNGSPAGNFPTAETFQTNAPPFTTPTLALFSLDLPVTSLVGYTGGSLCSLTLNCSPSNPPAFSATAFTIANNGTFNGPNIFLTSGTASIAATPEPTSMLLVGSGLLGVCAPQWYRRSKSRLST